MCLPTNLVVLMDFRVSSLQLHNFGAKCLRIAGTVRISQVIYALVHFNMFNYFGKMNNLQHQMSSKSSQKLKLGMFTNDIKSTILFFE